VAGGVAAAADVLHSHSVLPEIGPKEGMVRQGLGENS